MKLGLRDWFGRAVIAGSLPLVAACGNSSGQGGTTTSGAGGAGGAMASSGAGTSTTSLSSSGSGGMMCKVQSMACQNCIAQSCGQQTMACDKDAGCQAALKDLLACICQAQNQNNQTAVQQCAQKFNDMGALEAALVKCVQSNCANTQCS